MNFLCWDRLWIESILWGWDQVVRYPLNERAWMVSLLESRRELVTTAIPLRPIVVSDWCFVKRRKACWQQPQWSLARKVGFGGGIMVSGILHGWSWFTSPMRERGARTWLQTWLSTGCVRACHNWVSRYHCRHAVAPPTLGLCCYHRDTRRSWLWVLLHGKDGLSLPSPLWFS